MTERSAAASKDVIAVTGGTGFIGSHLLSRLDLQHQPTRALVRQKRNRADSMPAATEIISGSIGDRDAILSLLDGVRTCIHLAGATTSVDQSGFHLANVVGTHNLAACAAAAGVEHFIYVSSQAARAPRISNYAASKAMSETALELFDAKMRITIIRPPAVIGPGDPMLQPMFDLLRAGWLPAPSEPKGAARSFAVISVKDLVSHIIQTIGSSSAPGQIVEPCSVASTSWTEIASVAGHVLGRKIRIVRTWPGLMKGAGACADGLAKLTRRPFSISLGKVQELLAADWSYDHQVRDAMSLKEVFAACLGDDQSTDVILPGK